MIIRHSWLFFLIGFMLLASLAEAGVTNPDISVIGQLQANYSDDEALEDAHTPTLALGETELVFDAALNPYARGFFVFAVGEDGLETEEAYITSVSGLPDGFALKAGKYRLGFGQLNAVHPHAYPFMEPPRVLTALLPGEESFNDVALQASYMLPTPGDWAAILSIDAIQGGSFHPDETKTAWGWVGRWSNSFLITDSIPLSIGVSASEGTNNVQWEKKTWLFGGDIKTKIPLSDQTNVTLMGEYFYRQQAQLLDETTGSSKNIDRSGCYASADLKFWQRYNGGLLYEQYQRPENGAMRDQSLKIFAGFSLMEETTVFRLAYEHFMPEDEPVVHAVAFQLLFSMGPHKAHKF